MSSERIFLSAPAWEIVRRNSFCGTLLCFKPRLKWPVMSIFMGGVSWQTTLEHGSVILNALGGEGDTELE